MAGDRSYLSFVHAFIVAALAGPAALPPGVVVTPGLATDGADPRLGRLAGGFARAGLESFSAADMVRPPTDADRAIIRARWRSNDAQRLRGRHRFEEAAEAADQAIDLLERHAFEAAHAKFLVAAYVERGAAALALSDPITAETVFLKAVALEPRHRLPAAQFSRPARRLFAEVRRASRLLRYGSVRVTVPALDRAEISIDFGPSRTPPYETKLPAGRHFVTARAPGRADVVAFVAVRAERRTDLTLRPPTKGDPKTRSEALSAFDPERVQAIGALGRAAGVRFVALTTIGRGVVRIDLFDAENEQPVSNATATLSADPAEKEIDAAVQSILQGLLTVDPVLLDPNAGGGWYSTWWGITLIGVAIAGAGIATAVVLTRPGETEYRFEP